MRAKASLSSLIDCFYAAASGEVDWAEGLHVLADLSDYSLILGASGAGHQPSPMTVTARIDATWASMYRERFETSDPCRALARDSTPGSRRNFATAADRAELERSAFFRDWMAPQGFSSLAATAFVVERGGPSGDVVLTAHRPDVAPEPVASQEILRAMLPHLRGALRLRVQNRSAALAESVARLTLERFPVGVVTLDREGRCQMANAGACAAFGGDAGARVDGKCSSTCSAATEIVRRIRRSGDQARTGTATDPRGRKFDYVAPAADDEDFITVFLFPERQRRLPDARSLAARHGFTERESQIAVALADGQTSGRIAADLGVSVTTVRTHIRHLFEKTGVTRQTDLVLLLLGGPGANLFDR